MILCKNTKLISMKAFEELQNKGESNLIVLTENNIIYLKNLC